MIPLARMLDANLNRAREGLRVMEDVARFMLDSAELCGECKSVRHGLAGIAERLAAGSSDLAPAALLAARDTPGDVGTAIGTAEEFTRASVASVVAAASGRVAEALRVIEEIAKLAAATSAAEDAEASRYRVYDLQKRIVLALGSRPRRQWRLCVLVTESLCTHYPWARVVDLAITGGADCIQLREKSLADGELLRRSRELVAMARPAGVAVVINDRPDIAVLSKADGVHLGQGDLPLAEARAIGGPGMLIGVSTCSLAEAHAAVSGGADVCGVGPMFPTTTKHKPVLAGAGYLRTYLADSTLAAVPHLAIGGIGPENIGELARAGCRGVAVSSGVCSAADPAEVCRLLRRELEGAGISPARSALARDAS